jgi:hypothetical protein
MTSRRDRYSIVIILIAEIASLGAANAGPPSDACSLLTAPQVSSALGTTVGQGQPIMPNNSSICTWTEQGGPPGGGRNVTVSLIAVKSFENGKTPLGGMTKTPVSGIGDDAYFTESKTMVAGLNVKKGDACFQVRSRSNPDWSKSGKTPASEQKDEGIDRTLAIEILKKL